MFVKTSVSSIEEIKFCSKCKKPMNECVCDQINLKKENKNTDTNLTLKDQGNKNVH